MSKIQIPLCVEAPDRVQQGDLRRLCEPEPSKSPLRSLEVTCELRFADPPPRTSVNRSRLVGIFRSTTSRLHGVVRIKGSPAISSQSKGSVKKRRALHRSLGAVMQFVKSYCAERRD